MLATSTLRHEQYIAFRGLAEAMGYGRIRMADLRTRVTINTNGAQEAAADTEWLADFFNDAAGDPLAERTRQPMIISGQGMPGEFCGCYPEATCEFDQHATTLTDAEVSEFCSKMGESVLCLETGDLRFLEKRIGYFLTGRPAPKAGPQQGTASATSPFGLGTVTGARGIIEPMAKGLELDDPLLMLPHASIVAQVHGQGQWTTTDAIVFILTFHGWTAMQGPAARLGKVMNLSDAVAIANGAAHGGDAGQGMAAFKAIALGRG
jgi:hypothetical protein